MNMKLNLSPQRSDTEVTYELNGTTLSINGNAIDLSGDWAVLESDEGEQLESTGYLLSGERDPDTGEVTLTVRAPHAANAPESETFPEPVTLADGESVTFPRTGGSNA